MARPDSAYKFALYNGLTRDSFAQAVRSTPAITVENDYSRHLDQWFHEFGKSQVLVVLFEEMRSDPQAYINKVCAFLDPPPIDVPSLVLPAKASNSHSMKPRIASLARKGRRAINWLGDRPVAGEPEVYPPRGFMLVLEIHMVKIPTVFPQPNGHSVVSRMHMIL